MPSFYFPAYVRVDAATPEEAEALLPQEWIDQDDDIETEYGNGSVHIGWLQPEKIETGDLTDDEQDRADHLRVVGVGPPVLVPEDGTLQVINAARRDGGQGPLRWNAQLERYEEASGA